MSGLIASHEHVVALLKSHYLVVLGVYSLAFVTTLFRTDVHTGTTSDTDAEHRLRLGLIAFWLGSVLILSIHAAPAFLDACWFLGRMLWLAATLGARQTPSEAAVDYCRAAAVYAGAGFMTGVCGLGLLFLTGAYPEIRRRPTRRASVPARVVEQVVVRERPNPPPAAPVKPQEYRPARPGVTPQQEREVVDALPALRVATPSVVKAPPRLPSPRPAEPPSIITLNVPRRPRPVASSEPQAAPNRKGGEPWPNLDEFLND